MSDKLCDWMTVELLYKRFCTLIPVEDYFITLIHILDSCDCVIEH